MKKETLRLFVAVDLSDPIKADLSSLVGEFRRLAPEERWVRPEAIHLTLKFLGWTLKERVGTIEEAIAESIRPFRAFSLEVRGVGVFPNLHGPRVVWVGVIDHGTTLAHLCASVDAGLEPLGFSREERPFRPHLTLGRLAEGRRVPRDLVDAIAGKAQNPFGVFKVKAVTLMQSDLSPGGSIYTPLAKALLAA